MTFEPTKTDDIERQRQFLARFVQSRVRNRSDAEDIVQTVLIRGVSKLDSFRGDCPLSQWLLRIALNELKLYYSRSLPRQSRQVYLDELTDEPPAKVEESTGDTAERLLSAAKEACNADEFRVLMMFYRGETLEEISSLLSMSGATVRSHFMRGRANLLAHLVSNDPEMLGGENAIAEGARLALAAAEPSQRMTEDEAHALANPRKRAKDFRSACLKLARFLPLPIFVIMLMEAC